MSVTITIRDENAAGKILYRVDVSFQSELVSVRQLIRARVFADVEAYQKKIPEYFMGLIQPGDAEATLNGYRMKGKKAIDPEKQYLAAIEAFLNNGYFLLIDNIQSESLEQMVVINQQTEVSFIKLTPLVGG